MGRRVLQALVQWSGAPIEDTSWEDIAVLRKLFLSIHLEDKVVLQEGYHDTMPMSIAGIIQDLSKKLELSEEVVGEKQLVEETSEKKNRAEEEIGELGLPRGRRVKRAPG